MSGYSSSEFFLKKNDVHNLMAYYREKQEEFETLMEKITNFIDEAKFNAVLEQNRIYKMKLEDIIYAYVNYNLNFDTHQFDNLTLEEWKSFADVIDFSECSTIVKYRELMKKLLRNFPALRAKTLQGVYDKLHEELDRINRDEPFIVNNTRIPIPYLNWTPYYGGIISPELRYGARFRKWAIENSVGYFMEPNHPVMTQSAEAKYAAGYDSTREEMGTFSNEREINPATF